MNWPSLSEAQRIDWLRLIRTPRVGPALFQELINMYGSARAALDALPDIGARRGIALKPADSSDIAAEWEDAERLGVRFVARGEAGYPPLLRQLPHPPPLLSGLIGKDDVVSKPSIGIVGARNASAAGSTFTQRLASELGQMGFVLTSGLARGIDKAVHMGSLHSGTLAFLAGGLARPYPPEHTDLLRDIVAHGGAVYSEMPIQWQARAQDFPRRNRLVAGSSYAVIVVEAAKRSGSLITARQAGDMGRLVMAVPGFPLDPRSEGPNALLRDGATPVRHADDVALELRPLLATPHGAAPANHENGTQTDNNQTAPPGFDESSGESLAFALPSQQDEDVLNQALSVSPISVDDLIDATGVETAKARTWLVENELLGTVMRHSGDRFGWTV